MFNPWLAPGRLRAPLTIDPEPDPEVWTRPLPRDTNMRDDIAALRPPAKRRCRIHNVDTGEEYADVREAGDKLGIQPHRITNACKKGVAVDGVRLEYLRGE